MTETKELQGLKVLYNFITEDEEKELLSYICPAVAPGRSAGGRNRIMRYGSDKPYKNFMISNKIPLWLLSIAQKIVDAGLLTEVPNHCSINEYQVLGFVSPHIDSPESGDVITCLSLAGDADFELTKKDEKMVLPMPPRTLIQLSGEYRTDWFHSIPPVKELRYSLVFRHSK